MIDITPMGAPFIYIDYKQSDDLRDKILGRFLYESGALDIKPGRTLSHTPLNLHVLSCGGDAGRVQAMIEIIDRPIAPQQTTGPDGPIKDNA